MLKPPSWPWNCHALYVWSEGDRFAGLYDHFNITASQLRQWNCFLGDTDLDAVPDQKLCVNATKTFVRDKAPREEAIEYVSLHSSSTTHGHASTSSFRTKALDFTTYAIYLSVPGLSTEETPTMRFWTTYPTSVSTATGKGGKSTTTTATTRSWTTATTSSTVGAESEAEVATSVRSSRTHRRTKTTHSPTASQAQITTHSHLHGHVETTIYIADLSVGCSEGACASSSAKAIATDGAACGSAKNNDNRQARSDLGIVNGLQPFLPAHSKEAIKFTFTGKCDSGETGAEDCRIVLRCDTSLRQYPTCIDGECRCEAMACSDEKTCQQLHQCRADDEQVSCIPEPYIYPDADGICECTARGTGCLYADNPHEFCDSEISCTEKHFSTYPEFPQCVTSDMLLTYPRGRCDCQPVYCKRSGEMLKDEKACADLIHCKGGTKPRCAPKYGSDGKGADDGHCTCEV